MSQAQQVRELRANYSDSSQARKQLIREISCLERQLERLKQRSGMLDMTTERTYAEMIYSRKEMLDALPFE